MDEKGPNQENLSNSNLLDSVKHKLGWNNWHPISKTFIKLFPIVLILLVIPLTVKLVQQQQYLNQYASVNTVTVPTSIDATGATDVSTLLNAWIAAQPDGTTLIFPSGSTYQLGGDAGINLSNRSGLTLIGTGSTLLLRTTGASNFSSAFFLQNSTHIIVRGFTVDGGNTATGTTGAAAQVNEKMNAAAIRAGCSFIEFDHITWDKIRGFGPLMSSDGGSNWPSDISIHDSTIRGGEMGIGIVSARRVQLVNNLIKDSVYAAIDLEPDSSQSNGGGFQDVLISGNTIDGYGWGQNLTSWFVAANPQDAVLSTATMDNLTITGNNIIRGAATSVNGNAGGIGGIGIRADKANVKNNFIITNNTTTVPNTAPKYIMSYASVNNITVTGNIQPITNGATLINNANSSGTVVLSPNYTSPVTPTPIPTSTPTPKPTLTPTLTSTPIPTSTPTPKATLTPTLTSTPIPTSTPTPKATLTPVPINVPTYSSPTPSLKPTPTLTPQRTKHCIKFIYWRFCF